ncbi:hypothetical protein [Sorangium sp. So ce131]|uniref:hypothetical protein n=1 Tax=Sorangium sp. So ce131 TaxID=3133282 RepID=UPI003F6134E7
MASHTSYSIYVRFRGRRLALMKHIRSLETACSALRTLRAERFHDADQVFLVNDATKQIVDEAKLQAAVEPSGDRAIAVRSRDDDGDERGAPPRRADGGAAPPAHVERAPARLAAPEAPTRGAALGDSPEKRWSSVDRLEPPRARLHRAMAAAQAARARHDAALKSLIRLQANHLLDERALFTLERSARAASEHSACTLEQLDQLLKQLDSGRWRRE